jgi:malonyl-CoA O-methyltransferase
MEKRIRRVGAREGYDAWSETYDETPNPVVAMDLRHTPVLLAPRADERVLDAGCGTGRHLPVILGAGAHPVGVDFSEGMLRVARRRHARVPLACADLQRALPLADASFDVALCALVGEHLERLDAVFAELFRVTVPGGRLLFTVYHPAMAAAGLEANFVRDGEELRLGAVRHSVVDYERAIAAAGFAGLRQREIAGDAELVRRLPRHARYFGFPLLLIVEAERPR